MKPISGSNIVLDFIISFFDNCTITGLEKIFFSKP